MKKTGSDKGLKLTIVVAVLDRPEEIDRLLSSCTQQTDQGFDAVIVDDGSSKNCGDVVRKYDGRLSLKYLKLPKTMGPAIARNEGAKFAPGNFLVFVDSDCFLPSHYISTLRHELQDGSVDAFGGPDTGHESFTNLQKAIDYSMTAFLTTGGIRGGREMLDLFYPKGFNMGVKKKLFEESGGFVDTRFGEDTELGYRIRKAGRSIKFIGKAFVYHSRRNSISGFAKQVFHFGRARVFMAKIHPEALKPLHVLPTLATGATLLILFLSLYKPCFILPVVIYVASIFIHSTAISRSPIVGLLAIITSIVQVSGYGIGFLVQFVSSSLRD